MVHSVAWRWQQPFRQSAFTLLQGDRFERHNAISVFLMGLLPAVAGSAISFLLGAFFVWGVISLLFGRFPFTLTRSDKLLALGLTVFPVAIFITALLGDRPLQGAEKCFTLLPFLAAWAVIPRLRYRRDGNYLVHYITGAATGAILAFIFACVQGTWILVRPEGGAGNPAIFAMMSLALAAVAALNINASAPAWRVLSFWGAVLGLVASALALTRGVWLVSIIIMILMVAYAPRSWLKVFTPVRVLAIIALFFVAWALSYPGITDRTLSMFLPFDHFGAFMRLAGVDARMDLWSGAAHAFLDSPFLGYGVQNRMDMIANYLATASSATSYTHAHNGFLSTAVDGGLIGLAGLITMLLMPIVVAWNAPRDEDHRRRLFLAIFVTAVYAGCGMTQIMFMHDIMDSFFIFTAIVIAASVPQPQQVSGTLRA